MPSFVCSFFIVSLFSFIKNLFSLIDFLVRIIYLEYVDVFFDLQVKGTKAGSLART